MTSDTKVRRYKRVTLLRGAMVAWERSGGVRKCSSVSVLAIGGLFIATPEPPPFGDVINLVLDVPGGEVRARAMICDTHAGKGMGIQFTAMTPEARARLHLLMERLTRI